MESHPGPKYKDDDEGQSSVHANISTMPTQEINLQALVISVLKEFVSKDNRERHKKYASNQDYSQYNTNLIFHEFIGHKLYSLMVKTPKTYITYDQQNDFQIHSEKEPGIQTFNAYLCEAINAKFPNVNIDQLKEYHFLDDDYREALKDAINRLDGIGVLCFMAFWLQDFDVFGKRLDNVLISKNKKVSKIDTSEFNFNDDKEHFEVSASSLLHNDFFADYQLMPFFLNIYKLLDEKQMQAGINAIAGLSDKELKEATTWITKALSIDPQVGAQMYDVLRSRRNGILLNAGEFFQKRTSMPVQDIEQDVIIRPASDFKKTGKRLKGGNSNPEVSEKGYSEKPDKKILFQCAYSIIESLFLVLNQKLKEMEKGPKQELLIQGIADLKGLMDGITDTLKSSAYKRAELVKVYEAFNKIMDEKISPALDKDLSQVISRFFNNIWTKEPKSKTKTTIPIEEQVEQLKDFFNKKYHTFFQDRRFADYNAGVENNSVEPKKKSNG